MQFNKIDISQYGKQLYDMDVRAFNRSYDYPSPSVVMTLSYLKDCEVYMCEADGAPVGILAYAQVRGEVEVKQILVLPEYQNKGYGKNIVDKLIELTKGKKVWLVTHPKNTAAIILYLKRGFELAGWMDNYYGDGEPRIKLILK